MDFTTISFLAFLAVTALAYRLMQRRFRPLLLLVSSCLFYYWNSGVLLALLAADTAIVFYASRLLQRTVSPRLRGAITPVVVGLLAGMLVLFKGAFVLPASLAHSLIMPLGVSYYTFKLIGYLLDVHWGVVEPERSLVRFAAFAAFFPQIVAGPIQRAEQFLPQIEPPVNATRRDVLLGTQRILLGFFKKFVVADNLAVLVNFVYQHLHSGGAPVLLGFYGYPLQMYADFSALTDISVGAALLFGIVSPENFEAPFSAASPSEYWRRWHITLTLWLTDYVFTPLRMATRRFANVGLVFSLTLNMALIGLWHGFRWTFLIFGLVHAFYLSVDALTAKRRRSFYKQHPGAEKWADRLGSVFTFHLIAIAFVCFRAQSAREIVYVLGHLFAGLTSWSAAFFLFFAQHGRSIAVGLCGYAVAECLDYLRRRNARSPLLSSLPRWGCWSVYSVSLMSVCFLLMLLMVSGTKRSPFLYAIF